MNKMFYTTRDLTERWNCSERTVFRMMARKELPLPPPDLQEQGSSNRWLVSTIDDFDLERMKNTRKIQDIH
ncbi:MAG: hypothetical protein K6L75_08545 [Cellvibrionaceae bacterium]|jgi:hypothetical protein